MAENKRGKQSFLLPQMPVITAWASVAGKKESEGPLGHCFDVTSKDTYFGQKTWEQAEKQMQKTALDTLIKKAGISRQQLGLVFSGDLLNQCIGSSFTLRNMNVPHLGLYGACSTMAESLLLASMTVCGGFSDKVVAMTSSHFASSERQYRFPLGYGGQRTPTAQWTVTGSGASLLSCDESLPAAALCTHVTIGRVTDLGVADANNMGAAMAPAAADTLTRHFADTGRTPADYDLIVTGDLGQVGHDILLELMQQRGCPLIFEKYMDCGLKVFSPRQDVHAGGSGCGCSAIVLNSHILERLRKGEVRRVLFMATGALLSTTTCQQGETIPGIAHAIVLEGCTPCPGA